MRISRLARLAVLSPRQHSYLLRAALYLAQARIDLGRRPAKDILEELQRQSRPARPSAGADAAMLSWAIKAAASGVPWRSDCLIQTLAADRWLRRHGIAANFRLGVKPAAGGSILAHAWLELDGVVLTGGDDIATYDVLIGG